MNTKSILHNTAKILVILVVIFSGIFFWTVRIPAPLFHDEYSTVVQAENGEYLRVFLNENEQLYLPPDGDNIPDRLIQAVIAYEDQRFYVHHGVDPLAVIRAFHQNIKNGKIVSGASTITMQLTRLSRQKERNIKNKVIEMVQAVKIDFIYSKEEILNMYFTHAPYGGNIIGYKAASYRYFGKEPQEISWGEAAVLAVLPNSPALINPMQGREELKYKRDKLLEKLYNKDIIDSNTLTLAKAEPLPEGQMPFPLHAPLLARELKKNYQKNLIRTTINLDIQKKTENIVSDYLKLLKEKGINNCAVLIADTDSGEVKSYLGTADFYDFQHSGRIDGIQMSRSSGSILKPYLYGLAIDEGLIVLESVLEDIPISYGGYTPYNYDGYFSGIVSARKALIESLNAPTVHLLDMYGVNKFYDFLKKAGVSTLHRNANDYGLPLILGGAEVSLWDLASLYYSLGNYGSFSTIYVVEDREEKLFSQQDGREGTQLISPGASYLVLDILKEVKRPGLEYYWTKYAFNKKIAWKTGTSYGNRDAWAVGVSPQWTIAVWAGNYSGEENKNIIGRETAAPLLFNLFNSLGYEKSGQTWFERPDDLKEINVSANTGYQLNAEKKENLMTVLAPASAKPLKKSPYEKEIYVSKDESEEVCSLCWDRGDIKKIYRVVYSPQVKEFLKERGSDYSLPPHRSSCPSTGSENQLEIIYPQNGSKIFIPRGLDDEYQQLKFSAAHNRFSSVLYWYLDNKYLGYTKEKHEMFLSPDNGQHKLYIVDERGQDVEVIFNIERN